MASLRGGIRPPGTARVQAVLREQLSTVLAGCHDARLQQEIRSCSSGSSGFSGAMPQGGLGHPA